MMGLFRESGYSGDVRGFFVFNGERIRLAKTNGRTFVLAEPRDIAPGSSGELLVIVDGSQSSKTVLLPEGASKSQLQISYKVTVPF